MLSLSAKVRKISGKKVNTLRKKGILPAILYGSKTKPLPLEIDLKEFEKIYKEAGESSLVSLTVDKEGKFLVLIHDIAEDSLTEKPIHVDLYQPNLEEEVEVVVPLTFEGISLAVKDLGGTLVKNIPELKVKAKPQDLPKEIKVNIEKLETFDDNILISDLEVPEGVKILKDPKDIVASVSQPEKIEEELEKPIEEKVEEVEKIEEGKEKEEAKTEKTEKTEKSLPNE
jgi:large subunit ribosomal protein L25